MKAKFRTVVLVFVSLAAVTALGQATALTFHGKLADRALAGNGIRLRPSHER